jgi:Family of unknown function (DUF5767)
MSKSKINVIKVPNDVKNTTPAPTTFPRMPRMYLELIENKEKIKPTLVNKEYDPDEVATVTSETRSVQQPFKNRFEDENIQEEAGSNEDDDDDEIDVELNDDVDDDEDDERRDEDNEDEDNEDEEDNEDNEDNDDDDEVLENDSSKLEDNESNEDVDDEEMDFEDNEDNEKTKFPMMFPSREQNLRENFEKSEEGSVISQQSRKSVPLTREENLKKNRVREKLKEILRDPPKLSELEQRGEVKTKKTIPNMSLQSIEEEDELKRELLYKFELVKRSYKNVDIPEFNMHSDYKNMNKTYENTLRRVSLDSNVETYRNYLIAGFMLMEYILGYWLKFDMAGFTQQQILNMNQYERLLIELGEKSYVPDNKKWPVEVRLLGMIILNAVIFIVAKMIMTKTGTSLFGLMNAQQSEFQKNKPKRKMKGPNIDISTIPDIEEQSV